MKVVKKYNLPIPLFTMFFVVLSICAAVAFDVSSVYAQVDTLIFDWPPPETDSLVSYYKIYWSVDTSDYIPIGITPDTTYFFIGLVGHTYAVKVSAVDSFGIEGPLSEASPDTTLSGVDEAQDEKIPKTFFLSQNFPNPFNSTTAINYQLSAISGQQSVDGGQRTAVSLKIYNSVGEKVRDLIDGEKEPGYYMVVWNGRDNWGREVSSGVYYYQLQCGSFVRTRRMIFLK